MMMPFQPDNPGVDPDDTPAVNDNRLGFVGFILIALLIVGVVIGVATWAIKP